MIKINLTKSINMAVRWEKLALRSLSLLLLSTFYLNALAVDDNPTYIWSSSTTFINQPVGCGFTSGPFRGVDPKVIADNECAALQKHQACAGSAGWGTRRDYPPSIFISVNMTPGSSLQGYKYKCSGTNPSNSNGAYVGFSASISPKNAGDPSSCGAKDTGSVRLPAFINLAIGDPINLANGNKYHDEKVYRGIANNLSFNIAYNSIIGAEKMSLGTVWMSPYDRLVSAGIFNDTGLVALRRPSGSGFGLQSNNGNLVASSDKTYSLTRQVDVQGVTTGWTFFNDKNGETEDYDANGMLNAVIDRAGLTQSMTYSCMPVSPTCPVATPTNIAPAAGLLIQVADNVGRSLHFAYDNQYRIVSMTNPAGGVYTYAYDASNKLTSVTYPDGKFKTYHYESSTFKNALTGTTDENNDRFATWNYDSAGHANSSELAGALEKSTLVYNGANTVVTDIGTGSVRTYNLATILGVVKSTGQSQPAGSGCAASAAALTYDVNGNVASRTDFVGNKTTYVYDMARNLETSRTEGLTAAGASTSATRTITTTWHPTWRLPLVVTEHNNTGTALRITTNTYDAKGNITSITEADPVRSLSRSTTTTYTYSSAVPGLVLSKVVDGPRTDVSDITTYTYYPHNASCAPSSATPLIDPITGTSPDNLGCRGQLMSMTNALNQTTSFDRYNHHGQIEQMTDANGLVTTSTYDLRQRLLTRTVGTETTSLTYDGVGQVIQLSMPDNSQLNYTYDAAHRLTEVQDNLGNTITYTLDSEGNRINETTTDTNNQLTKTLTRSYDALNRLQQVIGVE